MATRKLMLPFKKLVRNKPPAARREGNTPDNTMPWGRSRVTATPKPFVGAFAPFPRSTWIHAHVPQDNYDRICKVIWRTANEAQEEFGSPEKQRNKECRLQDNKPCHRAKEQKKKEADDFGLSTRYEEDTQQYHTAFTLPCPRLSGHGAPRVAQPARELKPVMEKEMKRAEETRGNTHLSRREEDAGDGKTSVSNHVKGILVPESTSRENNQSSEPQPPGPNPVGSAAADRTMPPEDDDDPREATCEGEGVEDASGSCDSDSSEDEDFVSPPGGRSHGTDNSRSESESENDSDGEMHEILHSFDGSTSNSEQDSLYSCTEEDFPPLSTARAGIPRRPAEPPASGKVPSDWEIPLSFWAPHGVPAATLASCPNARALAAVRGKAQAPAAGSLNSAPAAAAAAAAAAAVAAAAAAAAAPEEQAYDLLADFPALQPPEKPLAPGAWRDGSRGRARTKVPCQERGGSRRGEIQIVPLEVFSICTRDQKAAGTSRAVSGGELKAANQPPPGGTDGVDTNARSWASAAKVGLEQAAAPPRRRPDLVPFSR